MQPANLKTELPIRAKRPPKPKSTNPIEIAIRSWADFLPNELLSSTLEALISTAPKRWTVYPPMILLPSGSFGSAWDEQTQRLTSEQKQNLWKLILTEIGKREGKGILSHLAVNSGIPLNKSEEESNNPEEEAEEENILRTPSGLIMLFGDFGPLLSPAISPTSEDFENAFWVSTKQNGITQIWAPRYTMFSRGNIKEKARLLDFHKSESRKATTKELGDLMAVDLYSGIGYFVFSYVMMGMGRVVGWELNPWSVEGLRRGAVANGWSMKVVRADEEVTVGGERILIFLEDNRLAEDRMRSAAGKQLIERKTTHVNCGLLPTSAPVWRSALQFLDDEGWLHLHENVGVNDIPKRSLEIEEIFQHWEASTKGERKAKVEHVELVKTFAPGVWHCVFDVFMSNQTG